MTRPSVSVIVPIFNVEKYLAECLDSLLAQSLEDIEIIAVNDCSTDGSRAVLEQYVAHPRIQIIDRAVNGGPSAARNTGLAAARGEYVAFPDPDDFVAPQMYAALYSTSQELDVDIVACGFQRVDDDGTVLNDHAAPFAPGPVIDADAMRDLLHRAHQLRFIWFVWRSIYRREMLVQGDISFDEQQRYAEDSTFNLNAFRHADGVAAVADLFYSYRANPASITLEVGNPYIRTSLQRQHRVKLEFYAREGFDQSAIDDLAEHVVVSQLPRMLWDASHGSRRERTARFREILALPMMRESLAATPLVRRDLPCGLQLTAALGKVRQPALLALAFPHTSNR